MSGTGTPTQYFGQMREAAHDIALAFSPEQNREQDPSQDGTRSPKHDPKNTKTNVVS
jgi:hypothetical protein